MSNANSGIITGWSNALLALIMRKGYINDTDQYALTYNSAATYPLHASNASDTYYVGLSTTTPTNTGTNFTEPSGGGYARALSYKGKDYWNAPSNGTISNKLSIVFPRVTETWGTVTHFGIFLTSSGSDLQLWGALTTSETPIVNTIPIFIESTLILTLIG